MQASKLALQQTIQQHNDSFCYPVRHVKVKAELLSAGSNHFEFDNLSLTICFSEEYQIV